MASCSGQTGNVHDHRRAVGVGDHAVVLVRSPGVDLRHDQRHAVLHAEGRRVVDHDAARRFGRRRELPAARAAGREECDVAALERFVLQLLDLVGLAVELELLAHRAGRGEEPQRGDRETPPLEDAEDLHSDCAGSADDRDVPGVHGRGDRYRSPRNAERPLRRGAGCRLALVPPELQRDEIVAAVRAAVEPRRDVLAMWEAGSAAWGREDAYSDVDLQLLVEDDAVAETLGVVIVPWRCSARSRSASRRLVRPGTDTNRSSIACGGGRYRLVDLAVMRRSAPHQLNERERHGNRRISFDKTGAAATIGLDRPRTASASRSAWVN